MFAHFAPMAVDVLLLFPIGTRGSYAGDAKRAESGAKRTQ
jgi:hypothetical protein